MKLDENDPLYSEWSNGWRATSGSTPAASSLAPHELALEEPETYPQVSPEHRARLQRYVKVTVAGCVALCMLAIVRVGVSRLMPPSGGESPPVRAAASHVAQVQAQVSPVSTSPAVAVVAPLPPPAAANPTPAPATSPEKTAAQERETARRALEKGKLKEAIAAAERATASDPTDAESWLILGAAHGELGHAAAARTAFRSCAQSAKRGPIRECAAMLR